MALQSAVQKYIETALKPLADQCKKKIASQKEDVEAFQALQSRYCELKAEMDATLDELRKD